MAPKREWDLPAPILAARIPDIDPAAPHALTGPEMGDCDVLGDQF